MSMIPIPIPMPVALYATLAGVGSHLLSVFASFAQAVAPAAIMALWQGIAVAFVLALSLRLAPRVSAAHRFAIWTAAFAVVAALPFLPLLAHSAADSIAQSAPLHAASARPWLQFDSRWGFIVAALWLIASALRAADLVLHSLRLRRLLKTAAPVKIEPSLRSLLASVSGSRRSVAICTTPELDRPSVIGFLAPRILIPDWLFQKLTPGEVEHVVLHEAEHLRRRDDWTNLLQKLSLVLFPLNPALVWMERRLCREREMACDEGVVRRTQAPRAYAACLTNLAERSLHRRAQALSLGAFERRPELVRRVHSILWRKRTLHPLAARAWVGALGCGLLIASVELARCPQMVAFVPYHAATPGDLADAQAAAPLPPDLRASNTTSLQTNPAAGGVRMIETSAILPDRHPAPRPATSRRAASQQSAPENQPDLAALETAEGAPRQVLLSANSPAAAPSSASDPERLPQMIVLTEWEQVQIAPHHGRNFADYDAGADAAAQNPVAANASLAQPATRVTVTQLILTVYPPGYAPPGSVPPAPQQAHAKNSNYGSATAVPFDGGWLVFAL